MHAGENFESKTQHRIQPGNRNQWPILAGLEITLCRCGGVTYRERISPLRYSSASYAEIVDVSVL
jgi:hypothetical protein